MEVVLLGGPPWGLRLTNDQELRPVVAKILPGGYACRAGLKIGDQIESINGETVESTGQAHSRISASEGHLRIGFVRLPIGTQRDRVRSRESHSATSSPVASRKGFPLLPYSLAFRNQQRNPQKQIRLDSEGTKGATQNKRRFFEQIESSGQSAATDRLLQRKMDEGSIRTGPSSGSTTGYDSVDGDFARSMTESETGSSYSLDPENADEKTIVEDLRRDNLIENGIRSTSINHNQRVSEMGPPLHWQVNGEGHLQERDQQQQSENAATRRSVAALREQITNKLEMKTPNGSIRTKTPVQTAAQGRQSPHWSQSVQIHEKNGVDNGKPYFGRVLDGPVPADKYYQGIAPPSASICLSPTLSSVCSEPQSKPPIPKSALKQSAPTQPTQSQPTQFQPTQSQHTQLQPAQSQPVHTQPIHTQPPPSQIPTTANVYQNLPPPQYNGYQMIQLPASQAVAAQTSTENNNGHAQAPSQIQSYIQTPPNTQLNLQLPHTSNGSYIQTPATSQQNPVNYQNYQQIPHSSNSQPSQVVPNSLQLPHISNGQAPPTSQPNPTNYQNNTVISTTPLQNSTQSTPTQLLLPHTSTEYSTQAPPTTNHQPVQTSTANYVLSSLTNQSQPAQPISYIQQDSRIPVASTSQPSQPVAAQPIYQNVPQPQPMPGVRWSTDNFMNSENSVNPQKVDILNGNIGQPTAPVTSAPVYRTTQEEIQLRLGSRNTTRTEEVQAPVQTPQSQIQPLQIQTSPQVYDPAPTVQSAPSLPQTQAPATATPTATTTQSWTPYFHQKLNELDGNNKLNNNYINQQTPITPITDNNNYQSSHPISSENPLSPGYPKEQPTNYIPYSTPSTSSYSTTPTYSNPRAPMVEKSFDTVFFGSNPVPEVRDTPGTSYDDPMITSTTSMDGSLTPVATPRFPGISLSNTGRRLSIDLESSELLMKSKSPAPYGTYSTTNTDHYGTMRRRSHSPVQLDLPVRKEIEPITPPATIGSYSYANQTSDSGYGGDTPATSTLSPDEYRRLSGFSKDSYEAQMAPYKRNQVVEQDAMSNVSSQVPPSMSESRIETMSIDSRLDSQPDRPDSILSNSTFDFASSASATADQAPYNSRDQPDHAQFPMDIPTPTSSAPRRALSSTNEPEMSIWYRNMFNKMHRIEPTETSILRYQLREQSPTPSNISRPLTPSSFVARSPSRFECDVTPRRARSVGRVVESPILTTPASPLGGNRYASERAQTPHFHLPSYKFRDEDPRAVLSKGGTSGGGACLRCGKPKKELTWKHIDTLFSTLDVKEAKEEKIQNKLVLRCISERLDATADELEEFIEQLDRTWKRQIEPDDIKKEKVKESNSRTLEDSELKRIAKEELMFRQKAERLTEELEQQKSRRHGYVPSASPSLQKNLSRFEGLMQDFAPTPTHEPSPPRNPVETATVVYKFTAKLPREMSLNKGEVIRINRHIDANWLEGERNGKVGIFPSSYVQIESEYERNRNKMRAVYPFTARNSNEMSLKMGEIVSYRRVIDANWIEGSNHLGEIGIFPKCYVQPIEQPQEPLKVIPDRPKTPKIGSNGLTESADFPENDRQHKPNPSEFRPIVQFAEEERRFDMDLLNRRKEILTEQLSDLEKWQQKQRIARSPEKQQQAPIPPVQPIPIQSAHTKAIPLTANGTIQRVPKGSETYRAVYQYSPTKEDELELLVDDIVFVVEKCDDGWYIGTSLRTGLFGTFPGNYVQRH